MFSKIAILYKPFTIIMTVHLSTMIKKRYSTDGILRQDLYIIC